MKKILLPFLLVSSIVLTVSCKKETDSENNPTEVAVNTNENANDIIEFSNNLLNVSRLRAENIDKIEKYSHDVTQRLNKTSPVSIAPVLASISKREGEVPAAYGSAQADLQKQIQELDTQYSAVENHLKELVAYMNASEFQNDEGAKGKSLMTDLQKSIEVYETNYHALSTKLIPIVDDAEAVVLKDHPMKDYIIGSKKAIYQSDAMLELIYDQFDKEAYDAVVFKTTYEQLEKTITASKNRLWNVSDANYSGKEANYNAFNDRLVSYLQSVQGMMQEANGSKSISEGQLSTVSSHYDSMIESYNAFID